MAISGKSNESWGGSNASQFFNSLAKIDFSELENVTVQEWLDKNIHDKNFAEIIKTLVRLNTYGNDPDIQSIGSALRQIYVGSRSGVMYVDGGWQTFVDGLLTVAKNANARIIMGKKATKVKRADPSGWLITLSDKTQVSAKIVVIGSRSKGRL